MNLKCKCQINNKDINTENNYNNKTNNFNYLLYLNKEKFSSYKTMKCSNLVFNRDLVAKNVGTFLMTIFLSCHFCLIGFFIYKNKSPLKLNISKINIKEKLKNKSKDLNKRK